MDVLTEPVSKDTYGVIERQGFEVNTIFMNEGSGETRDQGSGVTRDQGSGIRSYELPESMETEKERTRLHLEAGLSRAFYEGGVRRWGWYCRMLKDC